MEATMALSTKPYKGARDFYPEDMRLEKYIFSVWREVCEAYGYEEYDAPILEPTELYLSKGNEEIINEQTYSFQDRSGRNVTMRTEMTPSVARMVAAKRQELAYPLRWYSIPQCWRYERMQRGRGREFYQLNVDLFGMADIEADKELIAIADRIMQRFGARRDMYTIKVNSRKLTDYILRDYLGLDETEAHSLSTLIDRMHKMDRATFIAQADIICSPQERETGIVERLLDILDSKTVTGLPSELQQQPSLGELTSLLAELHAAGTTNVIFDPTLMRGFDYYTGTVFEVNDTAPENNRSMFGGGRYDDLVSQFGVAPINTVGFAMGDITMRNFLETHQLLPHLEPQTDLFAIPVGSTAKEAGQPISELREMGVRVAIGTPGRKLGEQLKVASKKGIRYALIIGEDELASQSYTLRDLHSGEEEKHSLQRIVSIVKDRRVHI
jgi:histidyl-tRNA synthetase